MSVETAVAGAPGGYPLRFDIEYPEKLSRWLIFVKWLLVIPVGFIWLLVSAAGYLPFAAFFTILFRRKYPRWWFDFLVNFLRFQYRLYAYVFLMRDDYPALEEQQAVSLEVDYPTRLNRWLPLVKWILAIPHIIVLYAVGVIAYVLVMFAFFAILFTGRFPRGLFDFVVGYHRWSLRVSAYAFYLLTDDYPPFSLR